MLTVPGNDARLELRAPAFVCCLTWSNPNRELMIGRGVVPGIGKPAARDGTSGRSLIIGRGVLFEGSGAPEPRVGGREVVSGELVL